MASQNGTKEIEVSARDLFNLQRRLRNFVSHLKNETHDPVEYISFQTLLSNPMFWDRFRRFVPDLDVSMYDISPSDASSLCQMQRHLHLNGLLRAGIIEPHLCKMELRDRELWQDLGYCILPAAMHKSWHDLVDEEFRVKTAFVNISSGGKEQGQGLPTEQLLAYHDRVFQQVSSLWAWRHGPREAQTPALVAFIDAYQQYRNIVLQAEEFGEMI